jgi:hypothetical protein
MTPRAEIKTTVACVFWRTDSGWRGECVELAAHAFAASFADAQRVLRDECHRVAGEAIAAGTLAGRHPSELSEEAQEHLAAVLRDGSKMLVSELCKSDAPFRHVLVDLEVTIEREVPSLDDEVDLGLLRFVFLRDGQLWVAQCLEYDLGGEGHSPQEAAAAAIDAIMTRIALDRTLGRAPLQDVPEAPDEYKRLYERGTPLDIQPPQHEIEGAFRVAA